MYMYVDIIYLYVYIGLYLCPYVQGQQERNPDQKFLPVGASVEILVVSTVPMAGPWPQVSLLLERGVLMPELSMHSGTDLASVMWLGKVSYFQVGAPKATDTLRCFADCSAIWTWQLSRKECSTTLNGIPRIRGLLIWTLWRSFRAAQSPRWQLMPAIVQTYPGHPVLITINILMLVCCRINMRY